MEINFYRNLSEKNKIGKDLRNKLTLNGNLREESSVINPTILVEHSNLSVYNYVYIPNFNRYYYISEITSVRNGLWRVTLNVDVLESFKTDIKNLNCIIDKNSYQTNFYINDGSYIDSVKTKTETIMFQRGLEEQGEYILITAGSGSVGGDV